VADKGTILTDSYGHRIAAARNPSDLAQDLECTAAGYLIAADGGSAFTPTRTLVSTATLNSGAVDASPAPTTGQKIVIDDIFASAAANMRLDFTEETTGTVILSVYLAANVPVQISPRGRLKLDTAGRKLRVVASAAGEVRITTLTRSEA
jgi:hypothetical protein